MTWEPTPSLKCLRRSPVAFFIKLLRLLGVRREVSILHANYHGSLLWQKQLQGGFYQPVGKYTFFLGIDFPLTANNHLPTDWEIDIFTHNQWLQVSSRPVSRDVWLIVTLIHLTIHCHTSKMTDLNTTRSLFAHPQVSPPAGHKKASLSPFALARLFRPGS